MKTPGRIDGRCAAGNSSHAGCRVAPAELKSAGEVKTPGRIDGRCAAGNSSCEGCRVAPAEL
ncbi:MAG: hypothetical protein HFH89_11060 [Lachnospiraceae bacterium]|nr:hypothetical protein [uncultured Acetatifactor sp.]MCI8288177.1 hypothetical protein [Lachnospiraceae bacterium]